MDLLRRAIRSRPAFPDAYSNLAVALQARGQLTKAENACRAALALDGRHVGAWDNLGNVLRDQGRTDDAADAYRAALRIKPDDPVAHTGLGATLLDLCRGDEAIAHFRRAVEIEPSPAAASNLLYNLHYLDSVDAEALAREARAFAALLPLPLRERAGVRGKRKESIGAVAQFYSDIYPSPPPSPARGEGDGRAAPDGCPRSDAPDDETVEIGVARVSCAAGRFRIGYVSPDFRDHTVPRFVSAALEHHDRGAFEVFLYHDSLVHDDTTRRLAGLGHAWRECAGLGDQQLARLVRDDAIDVLVDLRGHGAGNRLGMFARRAAAVQVSMVGYFDTTGLAAMDWRITDTWMDPPGAGDGLHTERLARLPGGCWCYRPDDDAPRPQRSEGLDLFAAVAEGSGPSLRSGPGVGNGYVTFGSLNKVAKVSPACARLWARVLEAVPGSRLLLSVAGGDPRGAVRRRLAEMGLPAERVDLADKAPSRRGYLETFGRIDVALDTFPFNGITTTCDCLWMGVPVVSLTGGTSVSRAGRSILCGAGMPELAADTPGQFVEIAARVAGDRQGMAELRAGMRGTLAASPLCDARRFAGKLEAAYRGFAGTV